MGANLSSESEWSNSVTLNRKDQNGQPTGTKIVYTMSSTTHILLKTVKCPNGSTVVYEVNPATHQMTLKGNDAGSDGDIFELGAAVKKMISKLNENWAGSEEKGHE